MQASCSEKEVYLAPVDENSATPMWSSGNGEIGWLFFNQIPQVLPF